MLCVFCNKRFEPRLETGTEMQVLAFPLSKRLRLNDNRVLYCDPIDRDGDGLFRLACEYDLQASVAKRKSDPCLAEHASWLKLRNQN